MTGLLGVFAMLTDFLSPAVSGQTQLTPQYSTESLHQHSGLNRTLVDSCPSPSQLQAMNWITDRAPTEKDGDGGGGYVVTVAHFPYRGEFRLKPWKNVVKGEPFIPWEDPYPNSGSENEKPSGASVSKTFTVQQPGAEFSVTVEFFPDTPLISFFPT